MPTPAEEIRQAADKLRTHAEGAAEGPWTVDGWGCIATARSEEVAEVWPLKNGDHNAHYIAAMHPGVGAALAKHLRDVEALHTPTTCQHEGCMPHGCEWCGDEDWPCADVRNALAIARAINGTNQ